MENSNTKTNQNIICIQEGEQEYFDVFVKKHNLNWSLEDKRNSIISLSKSYVGYIVTPIRKINLKPKYREIGFDHVFRMYLYVYGYKSNESPSVLDVSESEKDIDVAKLFLDSLQRNIQLGVIQTYKKERIASYELVGRVDYSKTFMRHLTGKKKYVSTSVSKLSLNNLHNRMIMTALSKLVHIKKYSTSALSYTMYFRGVDSDVENGSDSLKSINFNSNTSRYRKTLLYAAMIIDQLDYEEIGNTVGTESFILNFDNLFEEFVAKVLKDLPNEREFITWKSSRKYADIFFNGVKRESRDYIPDIVFKFKEEDENFDYLPSAYAVLDVKNKAYGVFKNSDVYQILFYAKLLNCKKALLIYPSFNSKLPEVLVLTPEVFDITTIFGCYINIADNNGIDFLKSIDEFVNVLMRTLMDIEIK